MSMAHWGMPFIISYAAWVATEIWISARDRHRRSGARQDRGSLWGIVLAYVVALTAAGYLAGTQPWARIRLFPYQSYLAGVILMWAGMALRVWAVTVLGRFFRITVMVQNEHRLVEEGPYRMLRHPAYTGSLITMIGIGLAIGNWLSLLTMILVLLLAYGYRIRVEEQALKARFGENYDRYAAARWRLVPFLI
jgi:protein-S-isoprenylcysteine O-methyltransferase Ste14